MSASTPAIRRDIATRNLVPGRYRDVAVSEVDVPLDAASLTGYLMGRPAYRRTRFIVARNGERTAIVRVRRAEIEPLFSPITDVEMLATPDECVFLQSPDTDTAIPSALAHAAAAAPDARAVVVHGRYEHVNFIIDPHPLLVTVREVIPPDPPKLLDQVRRVLAVVEDLPPMELVPDIVELGKLAAEHPTDCYLMPCRGSGFGPAGAQVYYLDEHPPPQQWVLLGTERSQQIHESFYAHRAEPFIDMCPRSRPPIDGALLSKCDLIEFEIEVDGGQVVVPWGASLAQIEEGLRELARIWEPAWAPA